ncbi:iron/manganese transport system membrane protein SitD [Escherichia coli]|nr:iron/manganese transport system membrane protein SitD [Escherichia coli]
MMALLLEPLQFTFMSHALLISLVVSIPCALLSVFSGPERLGTDG